MAKKSCLTNLLVCLEKINEYIGSGTLCWCYLSTLCQGIWISGTRQVIICAPGTQYNTGNVTNRINNWLSGRQQRVVLNDEKSNWLPVTSWVPQGSVMGPIFFVIFINPVDKLFGHLATILSKFADDTKTGRAVNNDKDHQLLQESLDTLVKWAEDW